MKYDDIGGSLNKYTNRKKLFVEGLVRLIKESIVEYESPQVLDEIADVPLGDPAAPVPGKPYGNQQPYAWVAELVVFDALAGKKRNSWEALKEHTGLTRYMSPEYSPVDRAKLFAAYSDLYDAFVDMKFKDGTSVREIVGVPKAIPGGGTDELDVVTDLADIHVKFNESGDKEKRLAGLQRLKLKGDNLKKAIEDGSWIELKGVSDIFVDELKALFSGSASTFVKNGILIRPKGLKKGDPVLSQFESAKTEYQNKIGENAQMVINNLNDNNFVGKLNRHLRTFLCANQPTAGERCNLKRSLVVARLFWPTPQHRNFSPRIVLEKVKVAPAEITPETFRAKLETRIDKNGITILDCKIYFGNEEKAAVVLKLEFRISGQNKPIQLWAGPGYQSLVTVYDNTAETTPSLAAWENRGEIAKDIAARET